MLRSYFLADQHNRKLCKLRIKQEALQTERSISDDSSPKRPCLGCEMDRLFQEFYGGRTEVFAPHRFLISTWRQAKYLAGYEQQDAHELFISTLNGLHANCSGSSLC